MLSRDKRLTLNIEHGAWRADQRGRLEDLLLYVFEKNSPPKYSVDTNTWVVSGICRKGWKQGVWDLSVWAGEDCIAVFRHWKPVKRRGLLIGPKAADWGGFQIDLFTFYEEVV